MTKVGLAACVLVACGGQREPADDGHPVIAPRAASDASVVVAPADPIDPARACGEPGPSPTRLPPRLFDGMPTTGDATVGPDETAKVGGVDVKYGSSVWVGTMENGHRGPQLSLLIDRAEAGDGPWGASVPVTAKTTHRSTIGPYQIDVVASDEMPPKQVKVHVEKRGCPDHVVLTALTEPIWAWASTEALRAITVDTQSQMLQVMVDSGVNGPHIDITTLGLRQTIAPVPGVVRTVRADQRMVTIDAVEPGKGTHFDGTAWHADAGRPRFSVRVHVDNVDATPVPDVEVAGAACGAATAARAKLPTELARVPRLHGTTTVAAGQKRTLDGIDLQGSTMTVPPTRHGRAPTPYLTVSSSVLEPSSVSAAYARTEISRADKAIAVFEMIGAPPTAFRVRTFPVACTRDVALPEPDAPVYVWLSTVGHDSITFGPTLTLRMFTDETTASLGATAPTAYDVRPLEAGLVGHLVTLDGWLLQITDVVMGPTGRTPFPIAHVQVRVSRL